MCPAHLSGLWDYIIDMNDPDMGSVKMTHWHRVGCVCKQAGLVLWFSIWHSCFSCFASNVTWIDSIIMLLEQKDFSDTLVNIRVLIKCDNLFDSGFIAIFYMPQTLWDEWLFIFIYVENRGGYMDTSDKLPLLVSYASGMFIACFC